MDIEKILAIAGQVASIAAANGVPYAGLVGPLAQGVDQLINDISSQTGLTREEIAANTGIEGAKDLIELALDEAKGE